MAEDQDVVDLGGINLTMTRVNESFPDSNSSSLSNLSMAPSKHDNNFFLELRPPSVTMYPTTSSIPSMSPTTYAELLKPSPELTAIGVTLAFSISVLAAVLFAFALAMRFRSTNIAPRCEARPRNVIYNPDPCADPAQRKGNPFCLGWVSWVLNLTYKDLLQGVPGTGTRDGGMTGKMLTVNLDHIILLRFNALGLKIASVAMIVYCTICLPIYFYARCSHVPLGDVKGENGSEIQEQCTNEQNYTFSSYSRFTLGNVPDLSADYLTTDYHLSSFLLYMVSIASWIVVWFACFEMFHEWIDEVALRRVYYLEYNHYEGSKEELNATMMNAVKESGSRFNQDETVSEKHLFDRPVWIPHPEQRDTPSNIELYSVLVGGIPSKPDEAMAKDDLEAALKSEDSQVDWQMTLVSAFFDSCIPNQPGFSSSVAAVTILPSAQELSIAWRCWYMAAKKVSRLRFIRRRIIDLGGQPVGQRITVKDMEEEIAKKVDSYQALNRTRASTRCKEYSAEVLGGGLDDDFNDAFWKSLDLGPEQIGVYSMEFARGLAGCCPHGFCEQRISYCNDLDDLLEMEADAAEKVSEAFEKLKAAGDIAAMSHEKRKDLLTLTDIGTNIADMTTGLLVDSMHGSKPAKPKPPSNFQSTTEMQILKRRNMSMHRGFSEGSGDFHGNRSVDFSPSSEEKTESPDRRAGLTKRSSGFEVGLMRRASAARLNVNGTRASNKEELWELVENIASEAKNIKRKEQAPYRVLNGKWRPPTCKRAYNGFRRKIASLLSWTGDNSNEATDLLARDSTFAVVTFTSRQAAIAARQCLADGRGAESFVTATVHPVPPLADSAAFNICDFRGCTKPVTIGLNEYQKQWRKTFVTVAVIFLYIFYGTPIAILSEYGTSLVYSIWPSIPVKETTLDGFLQAQLLSLILAFVPEIFLFLANFGSNATSLVESENAALRYYWYFMLCFAMIGQSIARMFTQAYQSGSVNLYDILQTVARTIPVEVSFTWTNWIIQRGLVLTPTFYLLQVNCFVFACFGARCCVRMLRGGGSGNRLPYRIYVENATVLLCTLALSPAAPLLSPFAVLYFLVGTPLLRYVCIFTYKPPFDSGGSRWPLLFDTIIVSLAVAQVLLGTILFLKQALGAAIFAGLPLGPIFMFHRRMKNRFLQAYMDAALLQTSMLDGWDFGPESQHMSWEKREDFRKFVVDAHKASYVPVCIAATQGGSKNKMTAEPAVVVPTNEQERQEMDAANDALAKDKRAAFQAIGRDKTQRQFGAINRRHLADVTMDQSLQQSVQTAYSGGAQRRGPWGMSQLKEIAVSESDSEPERSGLGESSFAHETSEDSASESPANGEMRPPLVEPEETCVFSDCQGLDEGVALGDKPESIYLDCEPGKSDSMDKPESIYLDCESGKQDSNTIDNTPTKGHDLQSQQQYAKLKNGQEETNPKGVDNRPNTQQETDGVEIEMVSSATSAAPAVLKVTRLGSIYTLDSGEREYDFVDGKEKNKDD